MSISLVATSHGTDSAASQIAISALVDAVRQTAPHLDVREAFVDVQMPKVDTVVDLVEGLAVIVPLLLTPGFHQKVDIRDAADRPWVVAAAVLGADDRLTSVMMRRLRECGATRDDVVVLGSAGSTDALARSSVDDAAHRLAEAWGAPIEVGYVGGTGTPLAEVVERVRRPGRRIVVVSYLMGPGFFHGRLGRSGGDVVTRPLLEGTTVDPELVSLVLDRFAEAAETLDWSAAGILHPSVAALVTKTST